MTKFCLVCAISCYAVFAAAAPQSGPGGGSAGECISEDFDASDCIQAHSFTLTHTGNGVYDINTAATFRASVGAAETSSWTFSESLDVDGPAGSVFSHVAPDFTLSPGTTVTTTYSQGSPAPSVTASGTYAGSAIAVGGRDTPGLWWQDDETEDTRGPVHRTIP